MSKVWAYHDGLRLTACFAEHAGLAKQPRKTQATSTSLMFDVKPPPWCDCRCYCHREANRRLNGNLRCGRPAAWELTPPMGDDLTGSIWSCDQCVFQCE